MKKPVKGKLGIKPPVKRPVDAEVEEAVKEVLERYPQSRIASDLDDDQVPQDDLARQAIEVFRKTMKDG